MQEIKGYTAIIEYSKSLGGIWLLGVPSEISPHFGSNGLRLYTNKKDLVKACNKRKRECHVKRLEPARLEMSIAETHEDLKSLHGERVLVALAYYPTEEEGADLYGPRTNFAGFDSRAQLMENGMEPFVTGALGIAFDQAYHAASEITRQTGGSKARVATFKLRKFKI